MKSPRIPHHSRGSVSPIAGTHNPQQPNPQGPTAPGPMPQANTAIPQELLAGITSKPETP
jgi:hypothetical protein